MTTKIKTTLLTLMFIFGLQISLKAQDKYEYAVVKFASPYTALKPGIFISISGKEFEKIEIKKEQLKDPLSDYTTVLNYIQSMTNNGWRVLSTFNNVEVVSFVLERKKN